MLMLTDRYRTQKVAGLLLVLILSCIYSQTNRPKKDLTLWECLSEPEKYDNRELIFRKAPKIGEVFQDRFEIFQGNRKVMVFGPMENLKKGDYVTMRVTFHKEGHLVVKEIHIYKYRILKIVISIMTVILVGWIFFRKYRFVLRETMFMER
ncbi:MAG: hypothetical protein JSU92_00035 [Deltaproteobacteria bacterium]|nr:MAG: hypothetical protein JSU92_00035 [Deltaproteobacteria bacterium]